MLQPPGSPEPSPTLFFDTINAYQRTACLKAAVELDLFTAIGEGNRTTESLARRCETSARGTRILCDYLAVIGFLTKERGLYGLTPDTAAYLDRRSPSWLGTAVRFLTSPALTGAFEDIAAVVRKGGTIMGQEGTLAPEHPVWVEFARTMAPLMEGPAEQIASLLGADRGEPWKVLDIAAGHGLFGITLAKHNPSARVVALDWPGVLSVARENAKAAGVEARLDAIPGDAPQVDYGGGYDIVLLTNFLHHFDPERIGTILRKVHAALAAGGRAVTFDFVPNEDRISPPVPAMFSMVMLASTPAGDAYTFSEYQSMFRAAGFSSSQLHTLRKTFQQVIISRK